MATIDGTNSAELADRLEHAIATMQNDDYSKPTTEKRDRLVARVETMRDVIEFLRSIPTPPPAPPSAARQWIIDLVRGQFEPRPEYWPSDNAPWVDGAEAIADAIIANLAVLREAIANKRATEDGNG